MQIPFRLLCLLIASKTIQSLSVSESAKSNGKESALSLLLPRGSTVIKITGLDLVLMIIFQNHFIIGIKGACSYSPAQAWSEKTIPS